MRSRLVPVFVVFGTLLLLTVGVWFFVSRPNDEQMVGLMLRNISHLEAFEYRGALSLAADRKTVEQGPSFDAVLYTNGLFAMNDRVRPDLTSHFQARLYFPEGRYGFRGDFTRANDATYLKLDESPSFGLLNLADVIGKWFAVPSLWDTGPVSREIRPLAGIIGEGSVFQSITRLSDEVIDGRAVYHMQATMTPDAFHDFMKTAMLGQGSTVREAENAVRFVRENMHIETIDLWVTKRGFDLYRVRALGAMKIEGFAPAHFIASVDLRRHNHAAVIREPIVSAPSIETVLSPIGAKIGLSGFEVKTLTSQLPTLPVLGGSRIDIGGLNTFSADTDRDGLSNLMEQVYGSDPLNPDSDGDGYFDGSEVDQGYNPAGTGTLR